MSGGPLLPSSVYFGAASGNAYPAFFTPTTNTNTAGYIEGVGVVASLGADAPVTLQFNMPESIPSGTLKLRILAFQGTTQGANNVAKLQIADASTSAGASIGATTLTSESLQTITLATADLAAETKLTLTATAPTANQITTVLATFKTASWTLNVASVWQFSLVWE